MRGGTAIRRAFGFVRLGWRFVRYQMPRLLIGYAFGIFAIAVSARVVHEATGIPLVDLVPAASVLADVPPWAARLPVPVLGPAFFIVTLLLGAWMFGRYAGRSIGAARRHRQRRR